MTKVSLTQRLDTFLVKYRLHLEKVRKASAQDHPRLASELFALTEEAGIQEAVDGTNPIFEVGTIPYKLGPRLRGPDYSECLQSSSMITIPHKSEDNPQDIMVLEGYPIIFDFMTNGPHLNKDEMIEDSKKSIYLIDVTEYGELRVTGSESLDREFFIDGKETGIICRGAGVKDRIYSCLINPYMVLPNGNPGEEVDSLNKFKPQYFGNEPLDAFLKHIDVEIL